LAYGSNLHPLRLGERVASATFETIAILPGHRLAFHKRGQDGSGKCNLEPSPDSLQRVFAAIYSMDSGEVPLLDRFEGGGYEHRCLQVDIGGAQRSTFAYVAPPRYCDPVMKPFRWYRELVCLGARHHGFPEEYLQSLAGVEAIEDRDPERRARNQALLTRLEIGTRLA
jgi:hypothetical protein